jgi:chromosome segregation ATPase
MRVLIETRMNALRLTESKVTKKGCLGRLEGVCADFKNPTRNGRLYPIELWKKVFNDKLFKESLENKTLFGELDHPEDRFEPLITEACVVMTDYRIDEDAGLIYGGFDILDTPKGKILKSIVDYGSVVGVSSRGQGDIIESADGERVDEDTYDFACFDVVATPAVEKARQNVTESIKRINKKSFVESVEQQISDAETVADLNIIRSVVRASKLNDSEIDTLIESIEDKCKTLQSDVETILPELSEESQPQSVVESAKTIRDNKRLYKCIKDLKEKVSAYKYRESRYVDTILEKDNEISKLSNRMERLQKNFDSKQKRVTENFDRQRARTTDKLNDYVKEIKECKNEIRSLTSQNSKLTEQYNSARNKLTDCVESSSEKEIKLQEMLKRSSERVTYLENQLDTLSKTHQKDMANIDSEVEDYTKLLTEAQSKIDANNDTIKELRESLNSTEQSLKSSQGRNKKLVDGIKSFQESYLKKVSAAAGINPTAVKQSISCDTTPQQIDSLVESIRDRMDRHNKVGIVNEGLNLSNDFIVGTNKRDSAESVEEGRLVSFLTKTQESL